MAVHTAFSVSHLFYEQLILHSELPNDIELTSDCPLHPQNVLSKTARGPAGSQPGEQMDRCWPPDERVCWVRGRAAREEQNASQWR